MLGGLRFSTALWRLCPDFLRGTPSAKQTWLDHLMPDGRPIRKPDATLVPPTPSQARTSRSERTGSRPGLTPVPDCPTASHETTAQPN